MLGSRLVLALEAGKKLVHNTLNGSNPAYDTEITFKDGYLVLRGYAAGLGDDMLSKFALDIVTNPENYTIVNT